MIRVIGGSGATLGVGPGLIAASPYVVWALLNTNGSKRLTVDQYSSVRFLVNFAQGG